jgi:uncharacterized protein
MIWFRMIPGAHTRRDLTAYAIVVVGLASVFYVIGPLLGSLASVTKSNVPAAALMFVCPATAAFVLAKKFRTVPALLRNLRSTLVPWCVWALCVFLMPTIIAMSSVLGGAVNFTTPSVLGPLVLACIYLVSALGEEIGWTGFALPLLLTLWGELVGGIVLGLFWAAWHVIPFWEAGNGGVWIIGQCLFMVAFRLVLVRLSVLAQISVWPAVICHAAYNLSWSLSPDAGTHYNPWVAGAITGAAAAILFLMRGTAQRIASP